MNKNIFNTILDSILKNLDISTSSLGLRSEFRSRKIPQLNELTSAISDLKNEASKLITSPRYYLQLCIKLFAMIQVERNKYHIGTLDRTPYNEAMNIDSAIYVEEIEKSIYNDLEEKINALQSNTIGLTNESVIEILTDILFESYYLAKTTSNLVKQLAYNGTTIMQSSLDLKKHNEKSIEIKYQKILNFEHNDQQISPISDTPQENCFLDITGFVLSFEHSVEEGMSVISLEEIWDNIKERNEILDNLNTNVTIDSISSYKDFKIEYIKSICFAGDTDGINVTKLLGLILASSNDEERNQYIEMIPSQFLLNKEALINGIKKIKTLPYDKWINELYNLLVPVDLLLRREKLIRDVFERIVFQFDDEKDLDSFLSTSYLNIRQSQDVNAIEEMFILYDVSSLYDLSIRYEPDKYLAKKKIGIWSPFRPHFDTFESDCMDCINSISQETDSRLKAIEIAKRIMEFHKISNNERGVEICSESIIQLYMSSDDDYIATKKEFWDNSDEELANLKNQLNSMNEEIKKARKK